jgi:hypothetical protein
MGILRLPLNVGYTSDFPIIQYADNTLLIMEACPLQLFTLKAILNTFVDSTRLKVNYSMSSLYSINIYEERLNYLTATFHCQAGSLPFTYLGLPLSMNKPTVQDCLPLVDRVERRLAKISLWLTEGGKLQMVNTVLSSLTTFYLCSIKVPITILQQIHKYRRHCLWRGGDINATVGSPPPSASPPIKPSDIEGARGSFIRFQHPLYSVPARAPPPLVCATQASPYGLL